MGGEYRWPQVFTYCLLVLCACAPTRAPADIDMAAGADEDPATADAASPMSMASDAARPVGWPSTLPHDAGSAAASDAQQTQPLPDSSTMDAGSPHGRDASAPDAPDATATPLDATATPLDDAGSTAASDAQQTQPLPDSSTMDAESPDDADGGMTVDPADGSASDEQLPDCRVGASTQSRSARWAAVRVASQQGGLPSISLVLVGESGPGEPHAMGLTTADHGAPIGAWSADGAFFEFPTPDESGHTDGYAVVDVRDASALTTRRDNDIIRFVSWAPQGTRYLVLRVGGDAAIVDAADPESSLDVDLPPGLFWKGAWSADGRYVAMTADSDPHVYVVDTRSAAPRVQTYGADTRVAQGVEWSTTGHRLVYSWWDGAGALFHLMLLDMDAPIPSARVIADVESTGSASSASWLEGNRVLALTAGGVLAILDVSRPAITPEPVGMTEPSSFRFTRGSRCVFLHGACGPNEERGACVVSLDLGVSRQPWLLLADDTYTRLSPRGGSPAVLIDGPNIVAAPLDGSDRAPLVVNPDAPLAEFSYTVALGDSGDFIYYRATPNGATAQRAMFWSTRSEQTFTIDDGGPFSYAGVASDGRLFALASDRLLFVLLDDFAQPRLWSLDLVVARNATTREVEWQP